ncbi:MAG TPA: preprotein translocase subunit SecE [Epulopiscium sp.]|nr:preprotein translocase subunit SecE [Candidatus Epulonipiscium sp.]
MVDFFRDFKAEFKRVMWPNKKELTTQTITVITTSLIVAAIMFGMDAIFSQSLQVLNQLVR